MSALKKSHLTEIGGDFAMIKSPSSFPDPIQKQDMAMGSIPKLNYSDSGGGNGAPVTRSTRSDESIKKAREILARVLLKLKDYNWDQDRDFLEALKGQYLGKTGYNGEISFNVAPGRKHQMSLASVEYRKDSWVSVADIQTKGHLLEITLKFKKEGLPFKETKFQVGRYTKKVDDLDVLVLDDRIGLRAVAEIINRQPPLDWTKENIPNMVGMEFGRTDTRGAFSVAVETGFNTAWTILGKRDPGWDGKVISQRVKPGFLEFVVLFSKQGEPSIYKTLQVGTFQETLDGYGLKKGEVLDVLKISDTLGQDALASVISAPLIRRPRFSLNGLRIGKTNSIGEIEFTVDKVVETVTKKGIESKVYKIPYRLPVLGMSVDPSDKLGWEGKIVKSKVSDHYIELKITFSKEGGESVSKTFQITESRKKLKQQETKEELEVFKIEDSPGIEAIKELMVQKQSVYSNLEGLTLGELGASGKVRVAFGNGASTYIYPLGFKDDGWSARISNHSPRDGYHEITLLFSKKGEESFQRTFQIGPEKEKIDSDQGSIDVFIFKAKEQNKDLPVLVDDSIYKISNQYAVPKEHLSVSQLKEELDGRLNRINQLRLDLILSKKSGVNIEETKYLNNIRYIAGNMFRLLRTQAQLEPEALASKFRIQNLESNQLAMPSQEINAYINRIGQAYSRDVRISAEEAMQYLRYAFNLIDESLTREEMLERTNNILGNTREHLGILIRFLRMQVALTSIDGISQEKLALIEGGKKYVKLEDFRVIKEQLKNSYKSDVRLTDMDIEDLMGQGLKKQQETINMFMRQKKQKDRERGYRASVTKRVRTQMGEREEIPILTSVERLKKYLDFQKKLSEHDAQQLWLDGRKDELYEGLTYVIEEVVSQMGDLYAKTIFDESFSAGSMVLRDVLDTYDAEKHEKSLMQYLKQELRVRIPEIVKKETQHSGAYSLDVSYYGDDGETIQDHTAAEPSKEKAESFMDLRSMLDFVKGIIDEESDRLNGQIVHMPQKQNLIRQIDRTLSANGVYEILNQQGGNFGVYLSGQWGSLALTGHEEPLEILIIAENSHEQLNNLAADLNQRLNGEIINNNGTIELKSNFQGRPIFVVVVSSYYSNEEELEPLMEIFANAIVVHESRRGITERIARRTFDNLGDEATDYIIGHYEGFLEQQREILETFDSAQTADVGKIITKMNGRIIEDKYGIKYRITSRDSVVFNNDLFVAFDIIDLENGKSAGHINGLTFKKRSTAKNLIVEIGNVQIEQSDNLDYQNRGLYQAFLKVLASSFKGKIILKSTIAYDVSIWGLVDAILDYYPTELDGLFEKDFIEKIKQLRAAYKSAIMAGKESKVSYPEAQIFLFDYQQFVEKKGLKPLGVFWKNTRLGKARENAGFNKHEIVVTKSKNTIGGFNFQGAVQGPENEIISLTVSSTKDAVMNTQQIILPEDVKGSVEDLGEKPAKVIQLQKAGFNVPNFFVIESNGSGELVFDDQLRQNFDRIKKPVIVRSAHPDEGKKYSYSGVFESFPNITVLTEKEAKKTVEQKLADWDDDLNPESLECAYQEMVRSATEGTRIGTYNKAKGVTDFDPNRMNVVVMEQVDIDVFGMFVTSNQQHPDKVSIVFEVRGDENKGLGGVIAYDKKTHQLEPNKLSDRLQQILIQFGEQAVRIEQLFGVQQIELASSKKDGKVYVFQSRDINLGNPTDVPRYSRYTTLDEDLEAVGFGSYRAPVLVIDALDAVLDYQKSPEYRRIYDAFGKTLGTKNNPQTEVLRNELEQLKQAAITKYREELLEFQRTHSDYILVIKDAESVMGIVGGSIFDRKNYDFLNQLASKAKVVIRGRDQNAIRHEDWDHVDLGGVTIWSSGEGRFQEIFRHKIPHNERRGIVALTNDFKTATKNVVRQYSAGIATGDYLNVLSNTDGVFVWQDNAQMSAVNKAQINSPGGIDLNPAQMSVQVKKQGEDFKFNFNGVTIDAAQVTGATFTINIMTPVTNLLQVLELQK